MPASGNITWPLIPIYAINDIFNNIATDAIAIDILFLSQKGKPNTLLKIFLNYRRNVDVIDVDLM